MKNMILFSNQMNDSGAVVRQYFYMLFLSIYIEEENKTRNVLVTIKLRLKKT